MPQTVQTRSSTPPRVFVSSTVADLKDLRSAVRYFLEQYGFEVVTSDTADFPHRLDVEARRAAISTIDSCQYYLLFVGFRYGSRLDDLSVTQTEYRRACELAGLGQLSLLLFARASVADLWRHPGSVGPKESDDWVATCGFLDEIAARDMPGVSNWVHPFGSFRDVVEVLTANLRLVGPLRRRALEANLLWEARQTIKTCFYARHGYAALPIPSLFDANSVPEPGDLSATYDLTKDQAHKLAWFRMLCPGGMRAPKRVILADAITSGEFLEFDRTSIAYRVGPAQGLMLELDGRIEQFTSAYEAANALSDLQRDLALITRAAHHDARGGVRVEGHTLRWLFVLRNQLHNILATNVALARYLGGVDPTLQPAMLLPVIKPDEVDDPENDREMTDEEVDRVLILGRSG
jgi:Domain of unknown function (DUF4062)